MRIRWYFTLILPYASLGNERLLSSSSRRRRRFIPDNESHTRRRRGQEIITIRKKTEDDDRLTTSAPTSAPSTTVRNTYLPNVSPIANPTIQPTSSLTFRPTSEDRTPGGTEGPGQPILSKTKNPNEIESEAPTSTPTNDERITDAPTEVPATDVPSPRTPAPTPPSMESPSRAPMDQTPSIVAPQQPPSISCDDETLAALWQGLELPFTPGDVFADPNSYQCRALGRVVEQEGYQDFGVAKTIQYWVLYCIYFATNSPPSDSIQIERQGSTWENVNGWRSTNLDPCRDGWYGITCDENGRVDEIRLQRNGLSGTFPGEVSYLTSIGPRATGAGNLRQLELFNNAFLTNNVDDSWINELGPNLRILNYGSTSFKGPIPQLPSGISEFDCSYTLHSGEIPETVFVGLENLQLLIMDGNNFVSAVPTTVATLPNLEFFYIREASLQGDLSYMKGMPSIVEHLVDGNPGLTGPLYSFIGELETLRSFSASDCGLTGTIPTELGDLAGMVQLWLYGNKLSGYIPSELAQMSGLRILALEDTDITGNVPIEICLLRFSGALTTMSTDCDDQVDCTGFFPTCCTCCGSSECGT